LLAVSGPLRRCRRFRRASHSPLQSFVGRSPRQIAFGSLFSLEAQPEKIGITMFEFAFAVAVSWLLGWLLNCLSDIRSTLKQIERNQKKP